MNNSIKTKNQHNQLGFTIVELMIATAAFSLILLLATGAIIEVGKLYYKSLVQIKTQETARNISEDVTRSIQFSRGALDSPASGVYCIGDTRYEFQLNQQVDPDTSPSPTGLKAQRFSGNCSSPGSITSNKELLGKNMQLLNFKITEDHSKEIYEIKVRIAYGDKDVLDAYDKDGNLIADPKTTLCKSSRSGSNFCAVSELDNFVKKRLQ